LKRKSHCTRRQLCHEWENAISSEKGPKRQYSNCSTPYGEFYQSPCLFVRMAARKVDFLKNLARFPNIIKEILSYLDGIELCAASCVSKVWRNVCKSDRTAQEKRIRFLKTIVEDKENPTTRFAGEDARVKHSGSTPFAESQQIVPDKPAREPVKSRFEEALECAKDLPKDAYLIKCVHCSSPSRVLPSSPVACCMNSTCMYRFCRLCKRKFDEIHVCQPSTIGSGSRSGSSGGGGSANRIAAGASRSAGSASQVTPRLGSKKSRRSLRRQSTIGQLSYS